MLSIVVWMLLCSMMQPATAFQIEITFLAVNNTVILIIVKSYVENCLDMFLPDTGGIP